MYKQFKQAWKLFEVIFLHQRIVIALYRLDGNEKFSKLLRVIVTIAYFTDRNWISKTLFWMIYKE